MKFDVKKMMIVLVLGIGCNVAAVDWFGSKLKQPQFKPTEVEFRLASDVSKPVYLHTYYKNKKNNNYYKIEPGRPLNITIPEPIDDIWLEESFLSPSHPATTRLDFSIISMINDRIAYVSVKGKELEGEEGWVDIQVEKPIFEVKKLNGKYTIASKAR